MSLFSADLDTAFADFKDVFGVTVTYRRGVDSVSVIAVPTSFTSETAETEELLVDEQMQDVLIEAADLILSGTQAVPQRGDTIEWGGDTYEVLPPSGVPAWEWSDPYQRLRRIHTKLVDEA